MLHATTFDFLEPTEDQKRQMSQVRGKFHEMSDFLDQTLPEGPDKTYILRKLRECAMWANAAITRHADGTPRHADTSQ